MALAAGARMARTQDDMIAELRRANTGLQRRLNAALAQRETEYSERPRIRLRLSMCSRRCPASPGDPQPVFDLIVRQAKQRRNARFVALAEFDGELMHLYSHLDIEAFGRPGEWEAYER
jgi:hypothetical protein